MSLAFVLAVTGEFPAHVASNAENVSIWWRRHGLGVYLKHLSWLHIYTYSYEIMCRVWRLAIKWIRFNNIMNLMYIRIINLVSDQFGDIFEIALISTSFNTRLFLTAQS